MAGDTTIIGFFFIADTVFFERQERTLGAVICAPLRFAEYLSAKLAVPSGPDDSRSGAGTLVMLLVGFTTSLPFASISDWFLTATVPLAVLNLPILYLSGVWPQPVLYLLPTQGPLLLLGSSFGQVKPCAVASRIRRGVPAALRDRIVLGGEEFIRPLCPRQVGRGVMVPARALAAFGRNDIRGTYRDPLLVMVVVAPVIWTTGVGVLTPVVTSLLARRNGFDLVPYYPLILTAFLLLTSIIVGALAAFLVLDEIDAGTVTALRVAPVPISTFLAYRAATVLALTAVYVVATMSCSGLPRPGLVPALVVIGLLAGLSAVVTLLLIIATAGNKIQGLAMIRALGMLAAGLPCLPWIVHSNWNLAFGLLPPYWAAKAFWFANDHGAWWPYLLRGVAYNVAIAWGLFERFRTNHT